MHVLGLPTLNAATTVRYYQTSCIQVKCLPMLSSVV